MNDLDKLKARVKEETEKATALYNAYHQALGAANALQALIDETYLALEQDKQAEEVVKSGQQKK